jgi:hypothetical protein
MKRIDNNNFEVPKAYRDELFQAKLKKAMLT